MNPYETILVWSDKDQCFVADAAKLPGCMAHRNTPDAALAQVKLARKLCLDAAQSTGRSVPGLSAAQTLGKH